MWETIRNLIVTICSVLIGYFSPLGDIVFVIFFVFLLNCIFGLVAGVGVEAKVVTAASGTYDQTLASELDKSDYEDETIKH